MARPADPEMQLRRYEIEVESLQRSLARPARTAGADMMNGDRPSPTRQIARKKRLKDLEKRIIPEIVRASAALAESATTY